MRLHLVSFSAKGAELGHRLAAEFPDAHHTAAHGTPGFSLADWTRTAFSQADGLVFIGAAGIAVRAIAPHVRDKTTDPAVVVLDECTQFAIPLLSGHLGGANDLARRLARSCGALPVITTATDANGIFSVDAWARHQGLLVCNPAAIKTVSAKLLAGETVELFCPWDIEGTPPQGVSICREEGACDVSVSIGDSPSGALHLIPPIVILGVGCKRRTPAAAIEELFRRVLAQTGVAEQAVSSVCSIDLKAEEPGLLAFCQTYALPFSTFSAAELEAAAGEFSGSDFVQRVTGVDNVCERSAVLGSAGGQLYTKKETGGGVTMAMALRPLSLNWRWKDE